jgi:hypothetical protein
VLIAIRLTVNETFIFSLSIIEWLQVGDFAERLRLTFLLRLIHSSRAGSSGSGIILHILFLDDFEVEYIPIVKNHKT